MTTMGGQVRAAALALAALGALGALAGCSDTPTTGSGAGAPDGADPADAADRADGAWRTSTDPLPTDGLAWASGSTVHLADGTTIDTGAPLRTFVVAGDGVFFLPAEDPEDEASTGIDEQEVQYAAPGGEVTATGLTLVTRTLAASPDGRFLGGIDAATGEQDDYGTPVATARVFDLETGEEVVRSAEGMGDPGADDLSVLYENVEIDVAALTADTAYVEVAGGTLAYDLATGDSSEADPPEPDATTSPDGAWRVADRPGLADVLESTDGETVVPRTGGPRWTLSFWADDDTVVGVAVDGPGRGPRVDPDDTTRLMTCDVPAGRCDVRAETTGQLVVLPAKTAPFNGLQLQDGEGA